MGYDMYVSGVDRNTDHSYLRRNIFGMWPTLEAMATLGMVEWTGDKAWPTMPDPYDTHVGYDEQTGEPIALTDEGKAYLAAIDQHISEHRGSTPVIPAHKFSTNDGCHVTKDECTAALAAYDQAMADGKPHHEYLRDDVIPFLRLAAQHDGFHVH